ncbi:MAG: DUF2283 domain-containing protein [Nanoarchaeota archaeon]
MGEKMEKWYDKEEDILSIRINDGTYWKSIELSNGAVIDIAKDGSILGIEILNASKVFSKAKEVIKNVKQTA